ncbi:MAG TPA: P-loop NTPase [Acidimicrobiales bacterium]|jgi:pilus assembly protein CpaE
MTLTSGSDIVDLVSAERAPWTAEFGGKVIRCDQAGASASSLAEEIGARRPEVVVLGPDMGTIDALAAAAELDRRHPEIALVLVAWPSSEVWKHALEAGVRSVVPPTASDEELAATVRRLLDRVERTKANTVDEAGTPAVRQHRVITVLSPKGGVGKTTVATNLAAGLAAAHPHEVAIVDLDLQFGDVADSFLLQPAHTIADLPPGSVDSAGLKLMLASTSSSLYALCAPDDPAVGEDVSEAAVVGAVEALRRDLPFVVVDTGAGIDAASLAAVEHSTDLVFVGSLDVPSVRSVRKLLDALDRLGFTEARRHVVLNRADSKVGVSAADVVATLGMPISVEIPSSVSIPAALNGGSPVVVADPRSPAARAFQQLVGLFADEPAPSTPATSWFRRSLSRSAR